ncbi:MAG: arginine repressor [Clostridia bacterium]|nr:arginine repressor [Clostridia bacterium]
MKKKRLVKILEIIADNPVTTQEELQDMLQKSGYDVTQATVSRDIKELSLVKGKDSNGVYRYMPPKESVEIRVEYMNIFLSAAISVDYAVNDVVIFCHTGMANAACAALDKMHFPGVIGTLAGDDTILVIARNQQAAEQIAGDISAMLNN